MTETQPDLQADPEATDVTDALARLDGYEQLKFVSDGLIEVPIATTLGIDAFELERGSVTVRLTPVKAKHYNPIGSMHGGVISTLLDTAAACSVHSTLAAGEGYTSLDLNVKFLKAVTEESGQLRCVGSVVQRGRRTALAEAHLYDSADRLVAHATSTCMIFG
ncbi:PaaI family thioesterase [Nocardioides gilvus]|uniref:PaaI family thioesterase n=1 Tax=Nocardioides gilvus TaxID=1735589 RepID=UPI000D744D12|nr:PaaI family thioesterase [Nocardioides gilvus]